MNLSELGLFYLRFAAKSETGALWLPKLPREIEQPYSSASSATLRALMELQRLKFLEPVATVEHAKVLKWTVTSEGRQYLLRLKRPGVPVYDDRAAPPDSIGTPSADSGQRLIRLTYMSRPTPIARQPSSSEARLQLGEQARRLNREHGLTGALLVGSEYFIQVLEGDREPLIATLGRINHDPRHRDVRIFEMTETQERLFSNWAMHLATVDQVDPELIWRCVESFKQPSPARASCLIEALSQSVQAAA
jgi:hypothetical protein